MIRKFKEEDTTRVMALWTKGNFEAHDFIDKDYWLLNYNEVKEKYLKNAETYVYVKDNEIIGFISLLDDGYIGALFVCRKFQRQGIGHLLLDYAISVLGTSNPVITVSDEHIQEFSSILLGDYNFSLTELQAGYYRKDHTEYVFNGSLIQQ